MRHNTFGEPAFQPGDTDPYATFTEHFDLEDVPQDLWARFIEKDEVWGWGCTLADAEGNELQADGFASEENLRAWLGEVGAIIEA